MYEARHMLKMFYATEWNVHSSGKMRAFSTLTGVCWYSDIDHTLPARL